jgi:4a-hydroxytetrahydrobiopterin dehydratase
MPTRLSAEEVDQRLTRLPGWALAGTLIVKTYSFKDYHRTMAFVNAVAWIAHQSDHHPDLEVGYNKCVVKYSTHDAGGITATDFECATRVEELGAK